MKYHVLVDTLGLPLNVVVHAADIQDRDGAALVLDRRALSAVCTAAWYRKPHPTFVDTLAAVRREFWREQGLLLSWRRSEVRKFTPPSATAVRRSGRWRLRIVRRPEAARGFVVLPKRWIVERTLAWLTRCRRLARDLENLARTSVALIRLAMIRLMARRLARS